MKQSGPPRIVSARRGVHASWQPSESTADEASAIERNGEEAADPELAHGSGERGLRHPRELVGRDLRDQHDRTGLHDAGGEPGTLGRRECAQGRVQCRRTRRIASARGSRIEPGAVVTGERDNARIADQIGEPPRDRLE